ncbi:hypothetical protein M9Y10_024408 [Tritrichomonas musculus]|uniref:Uncharacterized protein n=1 Tax=Tritrichomonas musculus TaxID=1915356 RepID=A0ABR2GK33_9EUKA
MKVLELTKFDDYLIHEMHVRLCEYEKFKPSKRVRGLSCLAQTKKAAEIIMNHPDIFEVAPMDVAIIEAKKKT